MAGTPHEEMWSDRDQESYEYLNNDGLQPGLAYTILQIKEIKGLKGLKLRNPFGKYRADIEFFQSSDYKLDDDEFKSFCSQEQDGSVFWIKVIDLHHLFDNLIVCKVRNWEEVRVKGRFVRYSNIDQKEYEIIQSKWIYALDVPTKSQVIIGIH